MYSNKKLLSKARMVEKLTSISGTLVAEEADAFITSLVDQSVLKNNCRIIRMDGEKKNVRHIGFGSGRFLKPADSFSSSDYKTTFDDNKIELNTEHFRGAYAIYDADLEDYRVMSAEEFKTTVMNLIAKQVANELEEIAWIADAHSLGGFSDSDARSKLDGWRYQITHSGSGETYENDVTGSAVILDASLGSGHSTDFDKAGGISVWNDSINAYEHKYHKMYKNWPNEYKGIDLSNLRFWNHGTVTADYSEAVGGRATGLGDKALQEGNIRVAAGIPIVDANKMAITLDESGVLGGGSYTDVLLTPAKNLVMGIQRRLTIEPDRDAANERTLYFFSIRVDFKVADVRACVLCKNLTY